MEFHVRSARMIDVEPAVRVMQQAGERPSGLDDATDLLRSMLYLPAATVIVAEEQRQLAGIGILTIRPSVHDGGFVGVIDELAVVGSGSGEADDDRRLAMAASMLEQLVNSARNKGCARVEVTDPLASREPPLWEQAGFAARGAYLSRRI